MAASCVTCKAWNVFRMRSSLSCSNYTSIHDTIERLTSNSLAEITCGSMTIAKKSTTLRCSSAQSGKGLGDGHITHITCKAWIVFRMLCFVSSALAATVPAPMTPFKDSRRLTFNSLHICGSMTVAKTSTTEWRCTSHNSTHKQK